MRRRPVAAPGALAKSRSTGPSRTTPRPREVWHRAGRLDIDPEGPLRLEGQVVGPDGQGVGDAEVSIDSVPKRTTKTEGDGTFAFDKLVGRSYSVWAEHADMVGGPVEIKLAASSDPVVVRLVKGVGVTVTVNDEGGKPIAGAEVTVDGKKEHAVKTGDDGVASISPVHSGWFGASATATGYAPGQAFGSVATHGTGHVAIKLHKGVAIAGRVIDETGKPIGKAHVEVAGLFGNSAGDDVVTDAKGQFSIIAASAGTRALSVTDGEHAPAKSPPITVGDRPVTGVEITMQAGGVVAGRVIDTDGAPVPFATVRISSGGGQMMWAGAARQATTDRAGTFALRGLARTKLTARAESDLAASKIVDLDLHDTAERKGLELTLDVRGTISGVVIDETGQPVGEVQVNAFPDLLSDGPAEAEALAGMSSAHTDGAGAFTIRGLPDGAYKLWASRSEGGDRGWGETGTKAKAGERDVKITLAAPGSIIGTIEIAGSATAPTLANIQVGYQRATAIDKGVIKVDDVTPGTYDIRLRGVDFAEHVLKGVKIDPGKATDLGTITVTRGRRVTGKVVDATGSPVAGATVKIGNMLFSIAGAEDMGDNLDSVSGIRNGTSDQDGSFALIGAPPESTSIAASDPVKGQSAAQRIPAGNDDPPPVTLTLAGYGAIIGKVTMASQPQSGITITDSVKALTGGADRGREHRSRWHVLAAEGSGGNARAQRDAVEGLRPVAELDDRHRHRRGRPDRDRRDRHSGRQDLAHRADHRVARKRSRLGAGVLVQRNRIGDERAGSNARVLAERHQGHEVLARQGGVDAGVRLAHCGRLLGVQRADHRRSERHDFSAAAAAEHELAESLLPAGQARGQPGCADRDAEPADDDHATEVIAPRSLM